MSNSPSNAFSLDLDATEYSETAEVTIAHPTNGMPTTMKFIVAGADSAVYMAYDRAATDRRLAAAQQGIRGMDAATIEKEAVEILVTCTLGWKGVTRGGKDWPFSPENVRALYTDPKFRWLRNQVDRAIGDRKLFIKA
jgi:hypothetical protein